MMTLAEYREWITTDEGAAKFLQAGIDYVRQVDVGLPEQLVKERAIRRLYEMQFREELQEERPRQR